MPSRYDQLLEHTIVVADTGDVDAIEKIKPQDATTNPSLITKAAVMPNYSKLINDAVAGGKGDLSLAMDKVSVNFGIEITKIVPGYVSTEVDARLSFDTDATIEKARALIDLYKEKGIDKSRILIKIAATWEGIMAAKVLEAEGITCNLTLIFSLAQAIACAEAGVTLISPFVGRIMDFYKKEELAKDEDFTGFAPETDPGVVSVKEIYNYYKKHGYNTIVMGASFRNVDEIIQLVGCDRLTISPSLIDELKDEEENNDTVEKQLDATKSIGMDIPKIDVDEKKFRMMMCMNPMATEKLAEGIRGFSADLVKLETIISEKLKAAAATAASDDEEEAASDDEEEAASDDDDDEE